MKSILQTKILIIVTAICVVGYIAFGYFFPETGLDNLAPTDRLNLKRISLFWALTNAPMMWAAVIRFCRNVRQQQQKRFPAFGTA